MNFTRLGTEETSKLEAFVFNAACRLEHSASLQARAKEFLKDERILLPADSTLVRIVGEHRERARQQIFERIASGLPRGLSKKLDELLAVADDEQVSALQRIKANPSKPSVDGMLALVDKLNVIQATSALGGLIVVPGFTFEFMILLQFGCHNKSSA